MYKITVFVFFLSFISQVVNAQSLTDISPREAFQGERNLNVRITGEATRFSTASSRVQFLSPDRQDTISVSDWIYASTPEVLVISGFTVPKSAQPDVYDIRVYDYTNFTYDLVLEDAFTIKEKKVDTCCINSIIPNQGQQGHRNLQVQITGTTVDFSQGSPRVLFSSQEKSYFFAADEKKTVEVTPQNFKTYIDIPNSAPTGLYEMKVIDLKTNNYEIIQKMPS